MSICERLRIHCKKQPLVKAMNEIQESPLVSIIVPVYNAERFLLRLVEMIRRQSFSRWEACFVVDGDLDKSALIVTTAVREDLRMKLVVQPNRGVSKARNRGVQETRGETFTFIDVDDLILPTYLETLYGAYRCCSVTPEWVLGGWQPLHRDEELENSSIESDGVMRGLAHLTRGFLTQWLTGVVWAKLFNRAWFKTTGIDFDESLSVGEDTLFMQRILLRSNKVVEVSRYKGYGYRLPETGTSLSSMKKNEYLNARLVILRTILDLHRQEKMNSKNRIIYLANMQNCMNSLSEAVKDVGLQETYDTLRKVFPKRPWRLINSVDWLWQGYAIVFVLGMRTKMGLVVALYMYARIRQLQYWYGGLRASLRLAIV